MRVREEVDASTVGSTLSPADETTIATVRSAAGGRLAVQRAARLSPALRFPLVVILSLSLSSLGYSFLHEWTHGELATVAKPPGSWGEVAALASWRMCELALGWIGNYDGLDVAALNLLSHGPTAYLTSAFYGVRPLTAGAALSIDVLSSFIPFLLLRPLSDAHSRPAKAPNAEIITDKALLVYNVVLVGLIYCATLFLSLKTFLPNTLVLYFNGIPTIQPALDADPLWPPAGLLAASFGLAAPLLIFTPSAAIGSTAEDADLAKFDPVDATLGETLWWNLWGYTTHTKVAIGRTAVAVLVTGLNTYLQCSRTIGGIEPFGAAVYAAVWAFAAMMAGVGLQFVGAA